MSPLDRAPRIARVQEDRKGGFGLIVLAAIPVTAFLLGCWQVQRLTWKTDLIARFEDRIVRDPLPLPPTIDPGAIHDFDYRRVYATGRLRHDQEMLIGPRIHDGKDGYLVITPLERGRDQSKILMNRGWIAREKKDQNERRDGLPTGEVTVAGLLREPWKKNIFTPQNIPEKGQFYFPDVQMMAEWTESTPVWIEATLRPNLSTAIDFESKGIPMGRYPEVNLRNNHTQYIFTWWSLSLATTFMFYMFMRKRPSSIQARVRRSKEWQ
ncbi:MAG: surf-like protein [Alyxoria varia]|nr:MAG: surf-like protein [Alyxoria varia]